MHRSTARTISRRSALGLLAAAGTGYALLGPRGARRRSGRRVVIDYWEKWTGHEGRAMAEIVERFNRSQDRITVRYFATADIGQKAMVAIAGGDPPDVLGLWNYSIPMYAQSGALLDLNDAARRGGFGLDHYAAAIGPLLCHEGIQWAAANTCGTVALYYDREACRRADLDPDQPPRTIDQMDRWAERLTVVGDDGTIDRAGFLHVEPGWWSWCWGNYFGGRIYNTQTGRATAASAPNRRAYEWVQSYPERYGLRRLNRLRSTFGNYASMRQSFLSGKVAMVMQGPWLANVISTFAPDMDYDAVPFPVEESVHDPERPVGIVECDVLVVPRGAPHPEEAMQFIAFSQRPENVEHLSRLHAKGSPLREVSPEFMAGHPNRCVAVHDRLLRSPRAFSTPPIRTWPEYRDEFNSGLDRLWTLREPAADVLTTVERRGQEQLDRAAWALQRRRGRGRRPV